MHNGRGIREGHGERCAISQTAKRDERPHLRMRNNGRILRESTPASTVLHGCLIAVVCWDMRVGDGVQRTWEGEPSGDPTAR